jgi:hypothetical protein
MRAAQLVDEDIRGLYVAMDDATFVRILERVGNLGNQVRTFTGRWRARAELICEGCAGDEVAYEVRETVFLADLVDRDNRRVSQVRHTSRFAKEALVIVRTAQAAQARHLYGHGAAQAGVVSLIHGAERSDSHVLDQLESADRAANVGDAPDA